jgi:hypothetical protein
LRIEYHRRVEEPRNVTFCSSATRGEPAGQILAGLKDRSILTVGEADGFATNGGADRHRWKTKIRFRINNEAARAASLTISSKLLRLAEVVVSPKR